MFSLNKDNLTEYLKKHMKTMLYLSSPSEYKKTASASAIALRLLINRTCFSEPGPLLVKVWLCHGQPLPPDLSASALERSAVKEG